MSGILGGHEFVEDLFEQIGFTQIAGDQEHTLNRGFVLIRELAHVREQEFSAALKVDALFLRLYPNL